MTASQSKLSSALASALMFIHEHIRSLADYPVGDRIRILEEWPHFAAARTAAIETAIENDYLRAETTQIMHSLGVTANRNHAGRRLDGGLLLDLGILQYLASEPDVDYSLIAESLGAYLAGPSVPLWRHIVLDCDWHPTHPANLDDWEVSKLGLADWDAIVRPLPAAAQFAYELPLDPLIRSGDHVVLRKPDFELRPVRGLRLWPAASPRLSRKTAWLPLVLLNLWDDTPVRPIAEYLVEPGRDVEKVYAQVPHHFGGYDGRVQVPQLGPLIVHDEQRDLFEDFLRLLSERTREWSAAGKALARLRRSSLRFLEASDFTDDIGDILSSDDKPQVVLHYVSGLENLLSGSGEDNGDLRRRTAQRAAVLLGRNDKQRTAIYETVGSAYSVRNKVAHGDEPKESDLDWAADAMRVVLRKALTAAIFHGPTTPLSKLCDAALLNHTVLQDRLRLPVIDNVLDERSKYESLGITFNGEWPF